MDAKEWSDRLLQKCETCYGSGTVLMTKDDLRTIAMLLAESVKLRQTIETMKAHERERYASAAKALGVVAPCDRGKILNKGGE